MAAQHKCESCFELTTADRWVCDACHQAGLAAAREVQAVGGNMSEVQAAYAGGCYERAAEVRARRYATAPGAGSPSAPGTDPRYNPVPAGRLR